MAEKRPTAGTITKRLSASTRVLVIEDEHDIADFLRAYFRASGFDLVHLDPEDAGAAVAGVADHAPDCILLDVRLRGFSGLDVHRRLRDDPRFTFVPVIIVSADMTAGTRSLGAAGGLDGFVAKPFSVESLATMVASRVRKARRLSETSLDEQLGILGGEYLQTRLTDEVRLAEERNASVSFALLRLRSRASTLEGHGPDAARWVARQVTDRLQATLPHGAVLAAVGEDDLGVVLPALSGSDLTEALQTAIGAVCAPLTLPGGGSVEVAVAVGAATCPGHAGTSDELYMAADAALAEAVAADTPLSVAR